jgi:hypothetical protein
LSGFATPLAPDAPITSTSAVFAGFAELDGILVIGLAIL